jgi:hypothetical protein
MGKELLTFDEIQSASFEDLVNLYERTENKQAKRVALNLARNALKTIVTNGETAAVQNLEKMTKSDWDDVREILSTSNNIYSVPLMTKLLKTLKLRSGASNNSLQPMLMSILFSSPYPLGKSDDAEDDLRNRVLTLKSMTDDLRKKYEVEYDRYIAVALSPVPDEISRDIL